MDNVCRILLVFLTLLVSSGKIYSNSGQAFYSSASPIDFSVFEENGKVGLKNEQGEVLIPAQYDAMGWSNGQFSIVNNITGYQANGLWGLININNNKVTKPEFTDLSPGEGSLIVARKKIHGTVKIQAGCISTSGKEVIPFSYDGIRISSFRAIVYIKTGHQFKHGLIDFENQILIPLSYQNIYPLGSLRYGVEDFDNKTAIFSEDGRQITNFLIDSLSTFKKDFAVFYQKQRQGLIDRQGQIRLEPVYAQIRINDDGSVSTRHADAWLFLDGENKLSRQYNADSINILGPGLLRIKSGGKIQLTNSEFKPITDLLFTSLSSFKGGKALFKTNNRTGIINQHGAVVIKPSFKTLIIDKHFIRGNQWMDNKNRWIILDSIGNTLTSRNYEFIGPYNGRYFPVKNRGFWGAVNASGKEVVACVHDSLVQSVNDLIVVMFKGKYGIINLKEDWIVTPQSNKIRLLDNGLYLLITPKTKFLKSLKGDVVYFSDNFLEIESDHLLEHLPSGALWKINFNGVITDRSVRPSDVEEIFPESEGLRAIQKDHRYGFIDSLGRLRIANRYEAVKGFSGSLAAVKIRGRWGFINHEDKIAVQPVYDEVSSFTENFALVKQKNLFGIIDKSGRQVLIPRYDSLLALPGKRFKVMQNGLWGLADGNGKMIINPKFDRLDDLNNGYVIVERNSKFGLLTIHGLSTIPELYDGLTFDPHHNQYIAVKKSVWEVHPF